MKIQRVHNPPSCSCYPIPTPSSFFLKMDRFPKHLVEIVIRFSFSSSNMKLSLNSMKIAFSHIHAHSVTHTYETLAAGTFNLLENISKKSNSSSSMSLPSDWLPRPVEGPDWSLILRTDKNGYKTPGCSSWAPSLQKPEVQEAATAATAAAAEASAGAASAATKKSSSNPHLGFQCIQIHIFPQAGRGKEERGGGKKKPTT